MVLEDLGSTNGTYSTGSRCAGRSRCTWVTRIRIGDSEFTFER